MNDTPRERIRRLHLEALRARYSGDDEAATQAYQSIVDVIRLLPGHVQFTLRDDLARSAEALAELQLRRGEASLALSYCYTSVINASAFRPGANYWAAKAHHAQGERDLAISKLRLILRYSDHAEWRERASSLLSELTAPAP
jgi:hypothetical protein